MRNGRLSRSVPFSTARLAPAVAVFICTAASLVLLTACGSSGSSSSHGPAPIFTSVPVTAATQDVAYSYQLAAVDPSGGSVTFALTTGGSFFGASSLNSNVVTLSWTAPTGTAPFGYTVRAYVQTAAGGIPTYAATGGALSTAATSITLPPLAGGNTYVFSITADADGSANMLMSPFRSSLPTGYATVVSGPVTISSSALMPEIHGDRRAVERFSKPEASAVAR